MRVIGFIFLTALCATGQTKSIVLNQHEEAEVAPAQITPAIQHYLDSRVELRKDMKATAALLLDSEGSRMRTLIEVLNGEQETVEYVNWCIVQLRDKTESGNVCKGGRQ